MKHINLEQFAGGKLSVQLNKALEKRSLKMFRIRTLMRRRSERSMYQSVSGQTMKETLWQLR